MVTQDGGSLNSRPMGLRGNAKVVEDRAKLKELYAPILKTWSPEGLDDPRMTILRVEAEDGKFWNSPGGMLQWWQRLPRPLLRVSRARADQNCRVILLASSVVPRTRWTWATALFWRR